VTPTPKRRPVRGTWDEGGVEVPRAEWQVSRAFRLGEQKRGSSIQGVGRVVSEQAACKAQLRQGSRGNRTREEGVMCDPDAKASARAWGERRKQAHPVVEALASVAGRTRATSGGWGRVSRPFRVGAKRETSRWRGLCLGQRVGLCVSDQAVCESRLP